jgi:TetR/AcrR family tetracycline transcriptional repressor
MTEDRAVRRRPAPPTRTTLTRGYISAVALFLVDELGLDKFSMRRLGTELGVDPMAVYRYHPDQDALFDGIADTLYDKIDIASLLWEECPWRELLEQLSRRTRDTLLAHPHAVTIFATRPVRSDVAVALDNQVLALLRAAGFGPGRDLQVFRCLQEFTVGHALTAAAVEQRRERRRRKGSAVASGYLPPPEGVAGTTNADRFELGLAAMLDGFERLLT